MRALPTKKYEWLNLLLFPFKAYVVVVPIWMFISTLETFDVRNAQTMADSYIMIAYALCIPLFLFAALIQLIAHDRHSALVSSVFAIVTFIGFFFLLPWFALAQ